MHEINNLWHFAVRKEKFFQHHRKHLLYFILENLEIRDK